MVIATQRLKSAKFELLNPAVRTVLMLSFKGRIRAGATTPQPPSGAPHGSAGTDADNPTEGWRLPSILCRMVPCNRQPRTRSDDLIPRVLRVFPFGWRCTT